MYGTIETATGNLKRAAWDPMSAPDGETARDDVPEPPFVFGYGPQFHRWNGSEWVTVDTPAPLRNLEDGIYHEEEFSPSRLLIRRTRFATKASQGVYEDKVVETTFEYLGNSLVSQTTVRFRTDGSEGETLTESYFSEGTADSTTILKLER